MIALLIATVIAAQSPPVRPAESYIACLRNHGVTMPENATEAQWHLGWSATLEQCRHNRVLWRRYLYDIHSHLSDRLNLVQQQLMDTELEMYRRYRNPPRVETIVDYFYAPEDKVRAEDR